MTYMVVMVMVMMGTEGILSRSSSSPDWSTRQSPGVHKFTWKKLHIFVQTSSLQSFNFSVGVWVITRRLPYSSCSIKFVLAAECRGDCFNGLLCKVDDLFEVLGLCSRLSSCLCKHHTLLALIKVLLICLSSLWILDCIRSCLLDRDPLRRPDKSNQCHDDPLVKRNLHI